MQYRKANTIYPSCVFVSRLRFLFPLAGLKKFLAQYPSLFLIDGDYVHVNSYSSSPHDEEAGSGVGGKRDYIEEAKQYFKHKLLQYGIGTEVPIKSLLGHRSQASPQVRHISGQHIKEFTDFLMKHPDMFQVVDEYVLLLGCENEEDVPLSERLHLPQPSIDTKGTQQLLDFFAQCIEVKGMYGFDGIGDGCVPQHNLQ
jgi:exonuclease 3'-5' domain-containing protein 1